MYPANFVHALIAVPTLLFFAVLSVRSYIRTKNTVSLTLGYGVLFIAVCLAFYVTPVLLSKNSQTITNFASLAAALELIGGFFLWVAVARIYLTSRKPLYWTVIVASALVALGGIVLAWRDIQSAGVQLVYDAGAVLIYSPVSREYLRLLALQYTSCVFLGAAFWQQSRRAKSRRDKSRLRVFSAALLILGLVLGVFQLIVPVTSAMTVSQSWSLFAGCLLMAVFLAITVFVPDKQR